MSDLESKLDAVGAVDSMGIPASCRKPLCAPGQHHPLCALATHEQAVGAGGVGPAAAGPDEPVAWAISFDGTHPYSLWDDDCALLDLEVKRQGGTACKIALYTRPQPPQVDAGIPASEQPVLHFSRVAERKLDALLAEGWAISGYSIIRHLPSSEMRHGFVTTGGLVGWWQQPNTPQLPQAVPPQWVGLTDQDRQAVFDSLPDALEGFLKLWGWLHFAKAIESRLREKNASAQARQPLTDEHVRDLFCAVNKPVMLTDDRELLELAAKAAGYPWRGFSADGRPLLNADVSKPEPRLCCPCVWNPLTDDGAAMRLAVAAGIVVEPPEHDGDFATGYAGDSQVINVPANGDPCAATRRAIVLMAAEIGRAIP